MNFFVFFVRFSYVFTFLKKLPFITFRKVSLDYNRKLSVRYQKGEIVFVKVILRETYLVSVLLFRSKCVDVPKSTKHFWRRRYRLLEYLIPRFVTLKSNGSPILQWFSFSLIIFKLSNWLHVLNTYLRSTFKRGHWKETFNKVPVT